MKGNEGWGCRGKLGQGNWEESRGNEGREGRASEGNEWKGIRGSKVK